MQERIARKHAEVARNAGAGDSAMANTTKKKKVQMSGIEQVSREATAPINVSTSCDTATRQPTRVLDTKRVPVKRLDIEVMQVESETEIQ